MKQPKVGHIDFLNVLPLGYSYGHGGAQGLSVVRGVPSELNDAMRRGILDASNVSSILYAREAERLSVLPDVCVSSDGAVKSILLVSRVPIGRLSGMPIALTAKSETSHALLRIILARGYGVSPSYTIRTLDPKRGVPEDVAAALFIGDDALHLYYHRSPACRYYDIGAEWKRLTGEKMVYALYVVTKSLMKESPGAAQLIYDRITQGFAFGLTHLADAIEEHLSARGSDANALDFTAEELRDYLGPTIHWGLGESCLKGLRLFYHLACQEGLIPREPILEFAPVARATSPIVLPS